MQIDPLASANSTKDPAGASQADPNAPNKPIDAVKKLKKKKPVAAPATDALTAAFAVPNTSSNAAVTPATSVGSVSLGPSTATDGSAVAPTAAVAVPVKKKRKLKPKEENTASLTDPAAAIAIAGGATAAATGEEQKKKRRKKEKVAVVGSVLGSSTDPVGTVGTVGVGVSVGAGITIDTTAQPSSSTSSSSSSSSAVAASPLANFNQAELAGVRKFQELLATQTTAAGASATAAMADLLNTGGVASQVVVGTTGPVSGLLGLPAAEKKKREKKEEAPKGPKALWVPTAGQQASLEELKASYAQGGFQVWYFVMVFVSPLYCLFITLRRLCITS
jgi:hypothetical protein